MEKINIIEFLKRISVVTWDSPKECIIHIFGKGEKKKYRFFSGCHITEEDIRDFYMDIFNELTGETKYETTIYALNYYLNENIKVIKEENRMLLSLYLDGIQIEIFSQGIQKDYPKILIKEFFNQYNKQN